MNSDVSAPRGSIKKIGNPAGRIGYWLLGLPIWRYRWVRLIALAFAMLLFLVVVTTPMELGYQLTFAVLTFCVALALNVAVPGRLATLMLVLLSVVASLRYMYWRVTATLGFEDWVDAVFGYGLLAAELYALAVLLLSYFQSAWPLRRKPVPLPSDTSLWPSVDIYVPTYNEPLSVVRQTVLAALSLDWPADRLKIYILDDGRREEFRLFSEQANVGYITRLDNKHAKAGNINAALPRTHGEYIAIFDCDHVPTRSFLQICMGWFLKDSQLAMLQTPHVFFSPDPIEHNLGVFQKVPNESQLFYGLVQDGNDLWNATFFCGSCAVLRREALLDVGGVAVESVTEDALTALKMNRRGYNTAYLAVPQAAGLATENLSRHIGQRIRWARGMAQILRSHNPLLGKGLSFSQRLCYTSAALHFFYGLPRLVFLTAPLAYIFFGAHVFQASALMVAAFVAPHIIHAQLTSARMQGKFRHSFWNEVYESVLAWYIMRPTLATLFQPDRATFNVTAKGAATSDAYFDWALSRPYIVLLVLNLIGMVVGIWQLFDGLSQTGVAATVAINLIWMLHNIVICSASVGVAGERRQFRASPRVSMDLPASIGLANGHRIACQVSDFSQEGLGLVLPAELSLEVGESIEVSIFRDREEGVFPAKVAFRSGRKLGLRLDDMPLKLQVELALLTFARADAWTTAWDEGKPDAPWTAVRQIGRIGAHGFGVLLSETWKVARGSLRGSRQAQSGFSQQKKAGL